MIAIDWQGNWLTASPFAAGTLWLGMTYAYLYSELVVRRSGIYSYLAACCFLMAEITFVGFNLQMEWLIAILAVTALAANLVRSYMAAPDTKMSWAIPPLALALSFLPIALGVFLHASTTSKLIPASWISNTFLARGIFWPFVIVMVLVAVSTRVSAWLQRHTAPAQSAAYFFGSAAAAIVAAAGLLRTFGLEDWTVQSPWLMTHADRVPGRGAAVARSQPRAAAGMGGAGGDAGDPVRRARLVDQRGRDRCGIEPTHRRTRPICSTDWFSSRWRSSVCWLRSSSAAPA